MTHHSPDPVRQIAMSVLAVAIVVRRNGYVVIRGECAAPPSEKNSPSELRMMCQTPGTDRQTAMSVLPSPS